MSFKDLTARAAAALKPAPMKAATLPAKAAEPTAAGKDAPPTPKTS